MSFRGTGPTNLAIVVDPGLSLGFLANTVGAIAVGLGAGQPGLGGVALTDGAGTAYLTSADRPVPILQADGAAMMALLAKAGERPDGAILVVFPAFARSLHSFAIYETTVPARDLSAEKIDGIGLCGPTKWVKSLTGSLKLLR